MKLFGRFIVIILVFNSLYVVPCYGQDDVFEDDYFVIIGAFSILKNAVSFTNHTRANFNLNSNFAFNANRNLHYVYVYNTTDRTLAVNEAMRLRNIAEFADAWVYYGKIDYENHQFFNKIQPLENDINPETEQSISKVSASDLSIQKPTETFSSNNDVVSTPTTKEKADERFDGKNYLFQIYKSEDSAFVEGSVDVIDVDRSRKIASYKGNSVVKVLPPLSKSDSILIVCNVFGFRRAQCPLSYLKPKGKSITINEQGAVVVPFELHRLEKGDIAVMYNVYFYKDASIMRPESLFEINSLLSLLNENEKYVIKIHGHTNGDAYGKIVLSKSKTSNFFSLNGTIEEFGSAKKLSEERANSIRNYLIAKGGINPNRMQIKAWGGKRPVQDEIGNRAQENVRVEIEILNN
jgi:outer membrane protein OmpA-like peptidoglycan-associated protein